MRCVIQYFSVFWGMLFWLSFSANAACVPAPIALTSAEIQQRKATAIDHGYLWKISKQGRTSWLYGAIHVNRLSAAFPGPKMRQALQQSQVIVLELDMKDAATQAKLAQLGAQGAGQIPPKLKARLKVQLDKVCLPESVAQAIHPTLLFSSLSVLGLRAAGFEAAYGTENVLAEMGKKIIPLETAENQIQALIGTDSKVSEADYAEALAILENDRDQHTMMTLYEAWLKSDLFTLESFADWCNCLNTPKQRADLRRLLDDRNIPMADSIAKLHNHAAPLFVAVGSLHMVGKNGLPALFAKRGFMIERVGFEN